MQKVIDSSLSAKTYVLYNATHKMENSSLQLKSHIFCLSAYGYGDFLLEKNIYSSCDPVHKKVSKFNSLSEAALQNELKLCILFHIFTFFVSKDQTSNEGLGPQYCISQSFISEKFLFYSRNTFPSFLCMNNIIKLC